MTNSITTLKCKPISRAAYQVYGDLICADEGRAFVSSNMGTAKRFNHLTPVDNNRPTSAKLNLCVFRCQPTNLPLEIKLLERHEFSTQVFLPMKDDALFVVIVCLGGDKPDLNTLRAFIVDGAIGISYRPGVWHYPMTALEKGIDFSCLVWEDGSKQDCEIVSLPSAISVLK
ncbi:MAG: ureidoglycolate lyase [Cyanobacteria bacterium]|nr:ureidoglycolate lyase [Cyanobacteriota bacterium]